MESTRLEKILKVTESNPNPYRYLMILTTSKLSINSRAAEIFMKCDLEEN